MINKLTKIAVLYGGISNEREVSLNTGKAMGEALTRMGYENVIYIDVNENFISEIMRIKPEVCVNGLHGFYGEDGRIQAVLESLGISYTGSGVEASCLGFDKIYTKFLLKGAGIKTADFIVIDECSGKPPFLPCVVKPSREGSTIGVSIVYNINDYDEAIKCAKCYDKRILVEKFIDGKEITVGIVGSEILPPIWIKPKSGFYDYKSKYTKGLTEYVFDTGCTDEEMERIKKTAFDVFKLMGCNGYARVDFIYDGNDPYVLEVNTLPGMTSTSLLPKAAFKRGISFEKLVESILLTAGGRWQC